nr:uncharacterized protein LOC126054832 isoform X3 [Helicoverpa armigera]
MTCKLDQVTNREWEEHRNSLSEPPTLAVFIEFIRNRADLLETLEESKSLFTKGEGVHVNNIKQYKHSSGSSETSRSPLSCPMCQKDHFIFQCDKFKSLPVQSRISKAQTSNVCLNCLRPGHNIYKCKMGHCKYCREKHNTLLHFDRDTVVPNQTTSTLASVNHLSTSRVVLLSTALVNVSDAEGNAHTARILLDNGSTTNLISQELARKLNISTYTVESKESSSTTKLRVVFDASATTSSGKSFNQIQMVQNANVNNLQRFRRIECLKQHFWSRFSHEYILWLQQRTKWLRSSGELTEGTLVVIKDKSSPPLLWLLGRIVKVLPGRDGIARVADIRTRKGVIRRAFNTICPLPVATAVEDTSTGGVC